MINNDDSRPSNLQADLWTPELFFFLTLGCLPPWDNKDLLEKFERERGVLKESYYKVHPLVVSKIGSRWKMPWSTVARQWEPAFVAAKMEVTGPQGSSVRNTEHQES